MSRQLVEMVLSNLGEQMSKEPIDFSITRDPHLAHILQDLPFDGVVLITITITRKSRGT